MNNLYNIAINELEKLLYQSSQNSPFFIEDSIRAGSEYNNIGGKNRNSFSKLPLNIIRDLEVNTSSTEALIDFIDILKILKNLDFEFRNIIKGYESSTKYDDDYERIYGELRNHLANFESNTKSTENPKLILLAALDDLFVKKYKRSDLSSMYFYFYNTLFAYISEYYNSLLNELANYYVKVICVGVPDNVMAKEFIHKNKKSKRPLNKYLNIGENFTFLSYAFHDKLVSFLLFLEAKSEGIVLFVDWMYSYDLSKSSTALKENLNYFLNASNKLVFLRSVNSELNTYVVTYGLFKQNNKMVRQWCSWEIGNFYKYSFPEESSHTKFQYNLHKDVDTVFNMQGQDVEENLLLGNLEPVNRMKDLF